MKVELTLPTTFDLVNKYLELHLFAVGATLPPQHREVLCQLLLIDHKLSGKKEITRDLILFNTTTKKIVREKLDINELSFNNILSNLRKNNFITKERLLFRPKSLYNILSSGKLNMTITCE